MQPSREWVLDITIPEALASYISNIEGSETVGGPDIFSSAQATPAAAVGPGVFSQYINESFRLRLVFSNPVVIREVRLRRSAGTPVEWSVSLSQRVDGARGLVYQGSTLVDVRTVNEGDFAAAEVEDISPLTITSVFGYAVVAQPPTEATPVENTTLFSLPAHAGKKKLSGITTVSGIAKNKKVVLLDQASMTPVACQYTGDDGLYEFTGLEDKKYSVVGVDQTEEYNSIIFANVTPVD